MRVGLLLLALLGCGSPNPEGCVLRGNVCHVRGDRGNAGSTGAAGEPGRPGVDGRDGDKGEAGTDGTAGTDGRQGADGREGATGEVGPAAPTPEYQVSEIIDPCGDGPGYDEVILRMANGTLMAHYANGPYQFLTIIGPGNYVTTDQQACSFTINPDMSIQ